MLLPIQNVCTLDVGTKIKKHWKQRIYYKNVKILVCGMLNFTDTVLNFTDVVKIINAEKINKYKIFNVKFYRCGC